MRSAILFGLVACLAFSLVLAAEDSPIQSNDLSSIEKDIGQAVESEVRAKRQFGFGGPFGGGFGHRRHFYGGYGGYGGYGRFGGPFGGFGGPFGGFGGPFGGFGGGPFGFYG